MLLEDRETLKAWKREVFKDFKRRIDGLSRRALLQHGFTGVKALLGLSLLSGPLTGIAWAGDKEKKKTASNES